MAFTKQRIKREYKSTHIFLVFCFLFQTKEFPFPLSLSPQAVGRSLPTNQYPQSSIPFGAICLSIIHRIGNACFDAKEGGEGERCSLLLSLSFLFC